MLPTIRQGDNSTAVKVAQLLIGYNPADGEFTAAFADHVKAWQAKNGLTADGIIGADSWRKIADAAPLVSTKTLRYGEYAQAVQLLVGCTADGIYGNKTKAAVKQYQSENGLKADGICGSNTWKMLLLGEKPAGKVINPCTYYCQWDSKWKKVMYSNHGDAGQTIGNSGCGPTSAAMILAQWIDPAITPVQTCADAQKHGYRTYDKGTSWGYFKHVFTAYTGFKDYLPTSSMDKLKKALREGALAVCSMNSNDNNFWTKGGHFIVAVGCDDEYIYAFDPNKTSHPRKQAHGKFKSCCKQAFIYWR